MSTTKKDAGPFRQGTSSSSSSSFKVQTITYTITEPIGAGANLKFLERTHLRQENLEYPRPGSDPGLILVFNQVTFENPYLESRFGSTRDVNEVVKCMQHQGYNVRKENIMTDGTREDILKRLDDVSNEDHSEANSLIVFFFSHGEKFNLLNTKDSIIQTSDIWKPFLTCKWLENKPKMFVFQACKGEDVSTIPIDDSSPLNKKDEPPPNMIPYNTLTNGVIGSDMVIVYSTIEGRISFRNPLTGTWFIQELCRSIYMYGRRDDVLSIITRATKCVSGNYYELRSSTNMIEKQMPMYISTLSKKFYLNRNKDRDQVLKVLETCNEFLDAVTELRDKIHRS